MELLVLGAGVQPLAVCPRLADQAVDHVGLNMIHAVPKKGAHCEVGVDH